MHLKAHVFFLATSNEAEKIFRDDTIRSGFATYFRDVFRHQGFDFPSRAFGVHVLHFLLTYVLACASVGQRFVRLNSEADSVRVRVHLLSLMCLRACTTVQSRIVTMRFFAHVRIHFPVFLYIVGTWLLHSYVWACACVLVQKWVITMKNVADQVKFGVHLGIARSMHWSSSEGPLVAQDLVIGECNRI